MSDGIGTVSQIIHYFRGQEFPIVRLFRRDHSFISILEKTFELTKSKVSHLHLLKMSIEDDLIDTSLAEELTL